MSETSEPPAKSKRQIQIAAIYAALGGQPVLLPIRSKQKGPKYESWERITYEDTQNPDFKLTFAANKTDSSGKEVRDEKGNYVREVYHTCTYAEHMEETGNIGVSLGFRSKLIVAGDIFHLCSIDVDNDEELKPFIDLNPRFSETLITRGRRGGNIWLWVKKDSYPKFAFLKHLGEDGKPNPKHNWGEWRTDGITEDNRPKAFQTVIAGTHPEGHEYKRISESPKPIRVDFSEIKWPEHIAAPWIKSPFETLVAAHGVPYHVSKNGAMTLNPPFWVGKYATERMVIHEPDEGRFYEYGAKRGLWQIDSEDSIRWKLCGDFKKVADEVGLPQLETKRTNQFLQSLVSLLKGCTEKREAFRREAGVIHLSNGMLDLRVEPPILTEFSPAFMSRNQIPVALDESAKCPRFETELLKGGIGRQADIDLAQKWAGQCLLGVNLTQTIMLFTGGAGTGKSTLINCVSQILGTANFVGLRTEHLHQRFELFNYVGKTLLIGADVPGNFLQTEGAHVLKALVGKDVLTAEKKNGESVTIIGDFNVGLTSNSKLKVKLDGDAGAWRRRLMIITYDKPAPRTPNPRFLEELIASEASGILNWMIEGARKLLAELSEHGRMQLDQVQRDRVDSLLSESDSLREFARNGIAPVEGDESSVTTMELVEAYVHFCEARGWNPLPTRKVEGTLPDFIMETHRKSRRNDIKRGDKDARGYRGLRIVPQNTDRAEDVAEAAKAEVEGGGVE